MPADTSTSSSSSSSTIGATLTHHSNLTINSNTSIPLNTINQTNGYTKSSFKFAPLSTSLSLSTISAAASSSSSSSSASSTPSGLPTVTMNALTIAKEARDEIGTLKTSPSLFSYKIPHYKSFVNKTDEVMCVWLTKN